MPTAFQKVIPSRVWIPGEEAAAVAGSVWVCSCATGMGEHFVIVLHCLYVMDVFCMYSI